MKKDILNLIIIITIIPIIFILVYFGKMWFAVKMIELVQNDSYIENMETKLNIYEQSYDNFVLEDSLRQSDRYE